MFIAKQHGLINVHTESMWPSNLCNRGHGNGKINRSRGKKNRSYQAALTRLVSTAVGTTAGTIAPAAASRTTRAVGQWVGYTRGDSGSSAQYPSCQRSWLWQGEEPAMPYVPPRVVVPPPHLMPVTGRCNLCKKVWRETLQLSAQHLKALQVMPIEWISPVETNFPFACVAR